MRQNSILAALLVFLLTCSSGCFPGVRVKKDPGPHDSGVRYYRPKPYLVLEPAAEGRDNDQHVSISMVYLPDYSEEYSIHVRPGLGSANVSIQLEDGWNLTQINQELDSQTDEIIGQVGNLLGKLPLGGGGGLGRFVVRSSNVPLGYYESVIGRDPHGRKQLYGWRYLGFLPYQQCPVDASGGDCFSCNEIPGPLFGLVFEQGTLTFKPLDNVAVTRTELMGVAPPESAPSEQGILRLPDVLPEPR